MSMFRLYYFTSKIEIKPQHTGSNYKFGEKLFYIKD